MSLQFLVSPNSDNHPIDFTIFCVSNFLILFPFSICSHPKLI